MNIRILNKKWRRSPIIRILIFCICGCGWGQQVDKIDGYKKSYAATRMEAAPMIDGVLSDSVWSGMPVAKDFVMLSPRDGEAERESHRTAFKIGYTDEAIFMAAYMYDISGTPIRKEFTQRDVIPQTDYIVIDLNTYNDGENQTRMVVTTAGGIADAKMKGTSRDYDYNIIWDAKVSIDNEGWYAEIKIPFSSLRFPKENEQLWSIQVSRSISSLNETYLWSRVDKSVGILPHYNGLLTGIRNINPPLRLGFYPFISGGIENYDDHYKGLFSAGMDVKYGINDAFTLDLTLIPDFGQVVYDDIVLNLGPFEQTFGEKRPFFTEGTDLFNKGNLFYSRRIGATPLFYYQALNEKADNEVLLENPIETQLLNAFKISGRTKSGLGIGFFNAITAEEKATYKNTETGAIRQKITSPLTNYNIVALDQQFKNNSSISFVNTNVLREGNYRDANVSAGLFDIYTKNSAYNISGEAKLSQLHLPDATELGFASQLSVQRSRGKFRYGFAHGFADNHYDINDLGVNFTNNYNNFFWNTSYEIFEPQGIFDKYIVELYGNHQRRYRPSKGVRTGVGTKFTAVTTKRFSFGGFLDFNTPYRDYFESRSENQFVLYPENFIGEVWISTDYRKRFAVDASFLMSQFINSDFHKFSFAATPQFRLTDRVSLQYSFKMEMEDNRDSYVTRAEDAIVFGNRDRVSLENSFQAVYNITTEKALSLSFRNYWSVAEFGADRFSKLKANGLLEPTTYNTAEAKNPNARFDIWNLDLRYNWRFAPASELGLLYRNTISMLDTEQTSSFIESTHDLFGQPIKHSLSVRVVYYIDYNNLKRWI